MPVLPLPSGSMLGAQVSRITLFVCSGIGTLNLESRDLAFILGLYKALSLSFFFCKMDIKQSLKCCETQIRPTVIAKPPLPLPLQ